MILIKHVSWHRWQGTHSGGQIPPSPGVFKIWIMKTFEENFSGFYTETIKNGTIKYYYQDPHTGTVEELNEFEYYAKMQRIISGKDTLERLGIN